MTVDELRIFIAEVESAMQRALYTSKTIIGHRKIWSRFAQYCQDNTNAVCDFEISSIEKFILDCYLGKGKAETLCKAYKQRILRAVSILQEYKEHGAVAFEHQVFRKSFELPESFSQWTKIYEDEKHKTNISISWRQSFKSEIKKFTLFLVEKGVYGFDDVDKDTLTDYFKQLNGYSYSMLSAMLGRLRNFYKWLYESERMNNDMSIFFPSVNRLSFPSHVPSTWTGEEINKLLAVIDRGSPVGKRDYAVLLLIARTGLRASDAIHIKYEHINWENNTINMIQDKTDNPINLPLMEDVGLAIIDYLKHGRPKVISDTIFLRHDPPHTPFGKGNKFHYQINRYLNLAGIDLPAGKKYGMHTLRHSLATNLLKGETPLPIIAEILGHKRVQSTSAYLRVDVDQLRRCALDPDEVMAE